MERERGKLKTHAPHSHMQDRKGRKKKKINRKHREKGVLSAEELRIKDPAVTSKVLVFMRARLFHFNLFPSNGKFEDMC